MAAEAVALPGILVVTETIRLALQPITANKFYVISAADEV